MMIERTETSIEGVRKQTKILLHAVPIICDEEFEFIVQHPFTQSPLVYFPSGDMIDLRTEDGYNKWIDIIENKIDRLDVYSIFFVLIGTAWKLTWLRFVKPFLSIADFSELLREAWTEEENPNMDSNVSIPRAISWFKEADKKSLMTKDEYDYWKSLPEKVVLYRGVSKGRKKYGLSWTENKETAMWFQNRFATDDKKGALLRVKVNKKHCLCYFNGRNEKEIVLDVNSVRKHIEDITG